jgi:5-methylcytosine-specific restriction endonuclease McrA
MVGDVCEGCCSAPVEHVHHLHPRALGGALYDFDNLMAVCWDCHDNMHAQLLEGAFWCSFEGVEFDAALAGNASR